MAAIEPTLIKSSKSCPHSGLRRRKILWSFLAARAPRAAARGKTALFSNRSSVRGRFGD